MKKAKFLSLCLLPFVLSSCDYFDFSIFDDNQDEEEKDDHIHTYATGWNYDENYHWHAAICEHSDLFIDKEAHNFNSNGYCNCGYHTSKKRSRSYWG